MLGAALLAVVLALVLASPARAVPTLVPDGNLESAIKTELGVVDRDLTVADLKSLTSLSSNDGNILDLSGLEYATNLTLLDLSNNRVSNLSPLAGLTNVQELYLTDNQIANVIPLAGLVGLNGLDLSGNQIHSVAPLAGLVNLTMLDLSGNQIADLAPLTGLSNLTGLYLRDNQIANVGPLAPLVGLTGLDLGWNQIGSITALSGLVNLEFVAVNENRISNIIPLAGLVNPQLVDVSRNLLDLTPGSATRTTIVDLQGRGAEVIASPQIPIYKITSAAGLHGSVSPNGEQSVVEGDEITFVMTPDPGYVVKDVLVDGDSVGDASTYTFGDVAAYHTIVASFEYSPLATPVEFLDANLEASVRAELKRPSGAITRNDMKKLHRLNAWNCGIKTLSGLEYATNLDWVNLARNQITDLGPLAGLTRLTSLELYCNRITDLTPLSGLTSLRLLTLSYNQITSAAAVAKMTQLNWLDLDRNQITEVTPLAGLTQLAHLGLNNNEIVSVAPLSQLSRVTYLELTGNEARDITPVAGLPALTHLYVGSNHLSLKAGGANMRTVAALRARGVVVYLDRQETHTATQLSGPSRVRAKKSLKLSGRVSPGLSKGCVTITKMRLVGNDWMNMGSVRVKVRKGRYSCAVTPRQKGVWRFLATYSGAGSGPWYELSKSGIKTVTVR
jgi:Leucine-rich repeat (LRR) protein